MKLKVLFLIAYCFVALLWLNVGEPAVENNKYFVLSIFNFLFNTEGKYLSIFILALPSKVCIFALQRSSPWKHPGHI